MFLYVLRYKNYFSIAPYYVTPIRHIILGLELRCCVSSTFLVIYVFHIPLLNFDLFYLSRYMSLPIPHGKEEFYLYQISVVYYQYLHFPSHSSYWKRVARVQPIHVS